LEHENVSPMLAANTYNYTHITKKKGPSGSMS
jgi:hypothetical protein